MYPTQKQITVRKQILHTELNALHGQVKAANKLIEAIEREQKTLLDIEEIYKHEMSNNKRNNK